MNSTLEVVLEHKKKRFKELEQMIRLLERPSSKSHLDISYTLELSKKEQIYWAKVGANSLYYDIQNYTKSYLE